MVAWVGEVVSDHLFFGPCEWNIRLSEISDEDWEQFRLDKQKPCLLIDSTILNTDMDIPDKLCLFSIYQVDGREGNFSVGPPVDFQSVCSYVTILILLTTTHLYIYSLWSNLYIKEYILYAYLSKKTSQYLRKLIVYNPFGLALPVPRVCKLDTMRKWRILLRVLLHVLSLWKSFFTCAWKVLSISDKELGLLYSTLHEHCYHQLHQGK